MSQVMKPTILQFSFVTVKCLESDFHVRHEMSFPTYMTDLPSAARSPSHKSVVPYTFGCASVTPALESNGFASGSTAAASEVPGNRQLCSNCSPSKMYLDGPILFEAPPLVEETVMDVSSTVKLFYWSY